MRASSAPHEATVNLAETERCRALAWDIEDLRGHIKQRATDIEEAARRGSVLPGIVRELVAERHLGAYVKD